MPATFLTTRADRILVRAPEHARLDQVLVLVVVDVEVVEHRDVAAAVRADGVVVEVDDDADEIGVRPP